MLDRRMNVPAAFEGNRKFEALSFTLLYQLSYIAGNGDGWSRTSDTSLGIEEG